MGSSPVPLLLVACFASAASAARAVTVPDTLAERVQACTACHGREGRATPQGYFPRLAGKPAGYLLAQLKAFRDGGREQALMAPLVAPLSDAYLREIAEHFAALELPYPSPAGGGATAEELARGQTLARQGDAARGLPACSSCHGEALTGVRPAIPGLLGLPRDYLVGQFGAWRQGQRRATAPDCMARIAQRLQATDIEAVARWLATQPVPATARPAETIARPLPLACGSDGG